MRHLAGDRAGLSDGGPAGRLRDGLGPGWGAPVHVRDETASTNDDVRALAGAGAPAWTVVLAARQTAGRGRQGRRWFSGEGHLFVSVLLRPPAGATWLGLVPLAAGVAVCDAARSHGALAQLKWPNDVLVGGRKLAGVLAEAQSSGGRVDALVVGIGVNVAARREEMPPELRESATSLADGGAETTPAEVAATILPRLRDWYDALAAGRADALVDAWRARSVPWWGRPIEVTSAGRVVHGVAVDVDADGALLLDTAEGRRRVVAGDARELRPRP